MKELFALCLIVCLSACTSAGDEQAASPSAIQTVKNTVVNVCKDAFGAFQTPLKDLNIKRDKIPPELEKCAQNPYAIPQPPICFNINNELASLNNLLGPDMEVPPLPWLEKPVTKTEQVKKGIKKGVEKAPDFARQQVAGMLQSKVNIIPFRGVVRKVTGAEKHANAVSTAYEAGKLRRAFLKGLYAAYSCSPASEPSAQ